ncbi:hypothetical protein AAFF_G00045030 [Aldrovandia affinis]|uniref:Tubulin polyglutamylase TTLL4 n=1 Tax=Aldrovandia affinis TaxID=143900 RepID=A0AAD7S222_9TELE|nr:hypothetical protein AAFF_G00045030 [Aldrovandia affinis]
MASGGIEELEGASSVCVHVPQAQDAPCPQDWKRLMSAVAPPGVRATQDQPLCASRIAPQHRAYLCVPAAASPTAARAGGVWDVCASCANGSSDGGRASCVVPKNPRPSSVPLVISPISLEPSTPSAGPSDPLRLCSGLLGKRAFSLRPSVYPTCPSPSKAATTMPTNQSSPWGSCQLRDSGDGTIRPLDAKVPFCPRQESTHLSLTASHSCDEPTLSHGTKPLLERWQNCTLDQEPSGQNLILDQGSMGHNLPLDRPQCESGVVLDKNGETMHKLVGGVSHLKTGTNSAQSPPCPASPPGPCLTNWTEEPCCISMDTSSAPCLDVRSCVCNPVLSAVVGRDSPSTQIQSDGASPEHLSFYSVTSQISSIHLTKESHPLPGAPSTPASPLQHQSTISQETVVTQDYGEEEELADKLKNQCSGDDDDGSESSSLSDASDTMPILPNVEELMTPELEDSRIEKPALVPSMFPFTPPTLYFCIASERVEMLPPEQSRLLKWKMSSVTPNVVKHVLARSHFRATKRGHDWLGCWGRHMRSSGFKALHEHQKLNHFPGSFQIGRKDRLWRNLSKMQTHYGKREFSFFPQSFVLPQDMKLLKKAWEEGGSPKWIIKPPASARGNGIQVIHRWGQMPRKTPLLVQKYLHKPFLISGSKFDLRIYVYVSSYDPLRIYIFTDGLVRFASCKYSSSMKSLSNKFMHLTNYSVNKQNSEYQSNSNEQTCQGHKWALKALWQYLDRKGVNTTLIWERIKDIVIKTIIAADPYVNALIQTHVRSTYSCHELFGFDIMLDENLKPWLLEVNISPSLHSSSTLDLNVKGQMVRDVLNLAGFVLPQQEVLIAANSRSSVCDEVMESKELTPKLSADEKDKRAFYQSQRFADQGAVQPKRARYFALCRRMPLPTEPRSLELLSSVLDVLTPGDVRVLVETEDELSRRGHFERVFPSYSSARYLRFFQQPRYLNILLSQWEQTHWSSRKQGLSLLRSLCQKGVHLGSTCDPAHTWSRAGQKFEPYSSLSPKQDPITCGVGSRDQDTPHRDLLSGTSSLSDIHLLGSPSPSPASESLRPKDSV